MPLSLNLSALVDGQTADASDVITPFNQTQTFVNALETALNNEITARTDGDNNLKNGATAFNQINMGAPGALTIAGGVITVTNSRHIIDTEGMGATDDLVTINGGVAGDTLILQIADASRTVTLKHNAGGSKSLFTYTETDILLNHPSKLAVFVYDAGTDRWCVAMATQSPLLLHGLSTPTTQTSVTALGLPDRVLVTTGPGAPRLDVTPGIMASNRVAVRASGATIVADLAAVTQSGTVAANNQTNTSFSSMTTGVAVGNFSHWVTTFDLTRRAYDPYFDFLIMMSTTLTLMRAFFGFFSVAPGNTDNPAGSVIGIRYLPADGGFKGLCDDATTLGTTSLLASVDPDTQYRLRIRVDGSGGGMAYFRIDNGAEVALNTGMPGAATNLGFGMYVYTDTTVARVINVARGEVTWK